MALQSPVGITSSYRPEGSLSARQPGPTYTTAGTIYDPSSSQPLQPPTRRGRSLKWNSGLPPDLTLLPKSLLSALPLHPHASTRAAAPSLQYSPLQQNYDRAVSPGIESLKPSVDGVAAQTPRTFTANMRMEAPSDQQKRSELSDDEDEESELRMKPLLNMPVKSLHNLASYPNPNQKIAQKVILRGVRSNLGSSSLSGPEGYGSRFASTRDEDNSRQRESAFHAGLKPPVVDLADKRSTQDLQFVNHGQMRASLHRSNTEGSLSEEQNSYTTLASGPGAPRPLTAGPPGQRQYRPSTFDTTFKALRAKEMSFGIPDGASSPRIEHDASSTDMSEKEMTPHDYMSALRSESTPFDPKDDFGTDGSSWVQGHEVTAWQREYPEPYFNGHNTSPGGWGGQRAFSPFPENEQFSAQPSVNMSTEGMLSIEDRSRARQEYVEAAWKSGQSFGVSLQIRTASKRNAPGVIGDKSILKGSQNGSHGEHISIDEANRMTVAEHSKPLLELVLASLDRNLSWSRFSTPDPSLVDDSPEGLKSFFGNSHKDNRDSQ